MTTAECVFCEIITGDAPATVVREWGIAIAIVPLYPVTDGHTLVIPKTHVEDFTTRPAVSAGTMWAASQLAADIGPCNLITNKGREATQSVFHLHLHVIPRHRGDGLKLPWSRT
jgi:histidine triad (HIT) family protein